MEGAIKIKTYKISGRGKRGAVVTLPTVWVDDMGLKNGDKVDIYRDLENRLIIEVQPK